MRVRRNEGGGNVRFDRVMPRDARPLAIGVLVATLIGCSGDSNRTLWEGSVRDSAGVALVHNAGGEALEPTQLSVDLRIGGDEARAETLFGHVVDLDVGSDGRIYVLDQQAQEVRVFGSDGSSLGTLGGPGEGPGEFSRFAQSLMVRADTLLVSDWGGGRLQRFSIAGGFLSTQRFPGVASARTWWRVGPDGSIWYRSIRRYVNDDNKWAGRDALLRVSADWEAPDTVLVLEYEETDLGGPGDVRVPLLVNAPTWSVLNGGRVAWSTLKDERVFIHDAAGELERVVSNVDWARLAPNSGDESTLIDLFGEKLSMLGSNPSLMERFPAIQPDALPAITTVRSGLAGALWVQRMGAAASVHPMALNAPDPPGGWGGGVWDVLDAEGRVTRSYRLPDRFRFMRRFGEFVYGVMRSPLDEEIVVRLRIPGV